MNLSNLYFLYLHEPGVAQAAMLATALQQDQPFESHLLTHYCKHGASALAVVDGPWKGRTIWIGPQMPMSPEAGQMWFDTLEVTAMVLVPRDPPADDWHPDAIQRWTPFLAWLSLRPVAIWQYRAYLEFARVKARKIIPIEFTAQDPERIFGHDGEQVPVTRVTCAEAKSFANWMGKELPSQGTWQAARQLIPDATDVLWSTVRKEWIGYPEPDEDEAIAISPLTIDDDPRNESDADQNSPPQRRMVYRYYDWSQFFGFRTAVFTELGLYVQESMGPLYQR